MSRAGQGAQAEGGSRPPPPASGPPTSDLPAPGVALVTGASGFVGAHLARRLVALGFEVHTLARGHTSAWRLEGCPIHTHLADIAHPTQVAEVVASVQPRYVFHVANHGVYGGLHGPTVDVLRTNVVGTANLLEACRAVPAARVVNTGSSSEYGPKRSAMRETSTCRPTTPYAVAKLAGTLLSSAVAHAEGRDIATLRLFSPYGPMDHPDRLIAQLVRGSAAGQPSVIHHPAAVRDFVYVDDVVDAYLQCAAAGARVRGRVFNVGSGRQARVSDVVNCLQALAGGRWTVRVEPRPARAGESPMWLADIRAIRRHLGWQPQVDLSAGLRATREWYVRGLPAPPVEYALTTGA